MQKSMLGGWMPIGGGFFCTGFASLLEYVTRAYAKKYRCGMGELLESV
jgi:hypothetical protein